MILKKVLFWVLAVLITLGASVYQRMTGPTHSKTLKAELDGREYTFRLPRSGGEIDCPVELQGVPDGIEVSLFWKKYPSEEPFAGVKMVRTGSVLAALLPVQPAAGKLQYYLAFARTPSRPDAEPVVLAEYFKEDPLVIRFKGDVPAWLLIPHILFMFASMLFAAYAFLCALGGMDQYRRYIGWAFWILLIGGFVLGPLVQHHAFGVYWSGFPMGGDLTDNKTLFALIALGAAVWCRRYAWGRWCCVGAVLVMFAVFSIPHSLRGSELDHETGAVITAEE